MKTKILLSLAFIAILIIAASGNQPGFTPHPGGDHPGWSQPNPGQKAANEDGNQPGFSNQPIPPNQPGWAQPPPGPKMAAEGPNHPGWTPLPGGPNQPGWAIKPG